MATAPTPNFTVLYNNRNITNDIAPYVLAITYSDKTQGETDEVSIELEDVDGRWQNSWYPEEGANLTVTMGALNCGTFEIDEIELRWPPNTVTIRAMAVGIKNSLRTRRSDAHEKKTLRQIAQKIADKNGYTIQGDIPDITIDRKTQNKETDVAFLKRISSMYGVLFSVRGKVITFTSAYSLEARSSSFTVDKTEIAGGNLKDKASGMIKEAKVQAKNAKKNSKVEVNLDFEKYKKDNPQYTAPATQNGNTGTAYPYAENTQQGEAIAKAIMHTSASNQQEGSISMQFNPLACAGNNFTLTGIGRLSGKYHIKASTHKMDRAGSVTEVEIKRLQEPTKTQQITNKPVPKKPQDVPVRIVGISGQTLFNTGNNIFGDINL